MEVTNKPVVHVPNKIDVPLINQMKDQVKEEKPTAIEETEKVTKETVNDKVGELNTFIAQTSTSLKFKLHDKPDVYYVQVIDTKSDEVLREIPYKKFLDMHASMSELVGLVVDDKY